MQILTSFCAVVACLVIGGRAFLNGHDLSSTGYMETQQGALWYDTNGKQQTLETILGSGGMNSVRLRLWTADEYGLQYTIGLAQRFSKAGYSIYLDMHLSDTWADPTHQAVPSGWDASSIANLSKKLRSYVSTTLQAFTAKGVKITILALGNEVTGGILFPLGQISNNNFSGFATLWAAARAGVRDAVATGTANPQVIIHIDNGWKQATVTWFFKSLFATGKVSTSDVDAFGFSFYPFFSSDATISALTTSLTSIANNYKKPIYVAETDWPTACSGVTLSASYPINAQGQREWTAAVIAVLKGLPGGLGAGVFYWEPAYVTTPSLGSPCQSALLFSVSWYESKAYAKALSSVELYI
ncbi:hypothetical protein HK100_003077 [Physocladia obscura]|uniref:Arabinogalactan endo-beta-1,4-galactanase n=1 Tax=Physocladia obscura TaxID=109957 RepID=A0AAD5XAM8_9FUNG|nr:hypothetical protein HK100_003077 [Physocladia obscura]